MPKRHHKRIHRRSSEPVADHPTAGNNDSLTDLQWLESLGAVQVSSSPPKPSTDCWEDSKDQVSFDAELPELLPTDPDDVLYRTDPDVKPPFSYATLICLAIKAGDKPQVTLSSIYRYIKETFVYYRNAGVGWQNSIRHNLSLNKCFKKVPRTHDERGKGGFWAINPEYAECFADGIFKRKRKKKASNPAICRAELNVDLARHLGITVEGRKLNTNCKKNTRQNNRIKAKAPQTACQRWNLRSVVAKDATPPRSGSFQPPSFHLEPSRSLPSSLYSHPTPLDHDSHNQFGICPDVLSHCQSTKPGMDTQIKPDPYPQLDEVLFMNHPAAPSAPMCTYDLPNLSEPNTALDDDWPEGDDETPSFNLPLQYDLTGSGQVDTGPLESNMCDVMSHTAYPLASIEEHVGMDQSSTSSLPIDGRMYDQLMGCLHSTCSYSGHSLDLTKYFPGYEQ